MQSHVKRVVISGGAGQIAYSLLFRIANGEMFGKNQPIALHILEIPEAIKALEGVKMELEDCALPLLKEIKIGSNPQEIFGDADFALLIGAKPRGPGMERADLLQDNAKIFVEQGKALNAVASPKVKVLVVGNPCNTNCLIAMHHAYNIPRTHFFAMTRLDQNRAQSLLARKANVAVENVTRMTIWGNHSATQVPDFVNAQINGRPVLDVIKDRKWLETDFIETVQKRGAAVIAARGKSSAASAVQAILDASRSILEPTPKGQWFSSGVYSNGNRYGIAEDLIFSFPCQTAPDGQWKIVDDLVIDEFLEKKIKASEKELLDERDMVKSLMSVGAKA